MSMLEAVASNPTVFTHLSLARNNLLSLSPDLTPLFSNLVLLDLSGNRLSSFPSHLHSLPHLRFLNLNKNQLTSVSVKLPDTRSSASSISSRSSAASKSNLIDRSPVFHMLTHLSISENSVEVIGDLSTVFPLLVSLNLSSNNILDVFEIKGCSVLDSLSELQVAGNPISRLASHRMNIFTYFKTKALSLKIDGALPTSAENKEILAGLTIAATTATTITSSKPAIISSTSAHHSAKVDMSSSVSDLSLGKKGAPRPFEERKWDTARNRYSTRRSNPVASTGCRTVTASATHPNSATIFKRIAHPNSKHANPTPRNIHRLTNSISIKASRSSTNSWRRCNRR
ncbi:outer arm dynein light chain 1 [Rhizoclosmatium globosum]|uniref:Outer arm dynein light chain 1 n=1 Tax=Rhizoclosmatium globosum TaxID=329046 RepID=A0A1Y2C8P3_9FUNG|nr:outer arm dynein light chain 1 [Rhizoclosmatium globosum]|eukprot:ORY43306.1 outer arm dynein light chain 1 [Rhizoclosmatium globosum]